MPKRKPRPVQQIGVTPDGQKVMTGAFYFVDTQGIPLDLVMETYLQHGLLISIPDFYASATAARWNPRHTLVMLRDAVADHHGSVGVASFDRWAATLK